MIQSDRAAAHPLRDTDHPATLPAAAFPPDPAVVAAAQLDRFVALSEALTDFHPLDRALATAYRQRFLAHPAVGGQLPALLDAYQAIVDAGGDVGEGIRTKIMTGPLLPAAQQLLYLWYVSAFFIPDPGDPTATKGTWQYGPPEHYPRGLMWVVARAHAPMTSGGAFGSWSEAPHETAK